MPDNGRDGLGEIQELVKEIKKTSEPLAKELERQLIQLCSCSAAIWNMASSTDPGYLRHSIGGIEDVEQRKRVIEDNLQHVLDFANNIKKSCLIGSPILEPYLEQATQACKSGDLVKYLVILHDMHMHFGRALNICYGAEAEEMEVQSG